MKKSSNTSSTQLSSRKKTKTKTLLDELYKSADPICIQAGVEIEALWQGIRLSNRNIILLFNALYDIQKVASRRDKKRKVTVDQLDLRLDEIVSICKDVRTILK
jgi:hypothetical protein